MSATNGSPEHAFTVTTAHGPLHCSAWAGDGPPAVLIHGVNGSSTSWARLAELTAGRRQLVAIDLRGRGGSPAEGPWGVGAHADDVAEALGGIVERLDLPATGTALTLVGHSFGAHVAACAARRAPERVADLVLIDGGPPRSIPAVGGAEAVIEGALGNILPHLDDLPFPVSAEAVAADFRSMVIDEDATASLAATTQPLLLIRAGHGVAPGVPPIIDDDTLAELVARRPVTSRLIADATHFSLLGDHAEHTVDAIVDARP